MLYKIRQDKRLEMERERETDSGFALLILPFIRWSDDENKYKSSITVLTCILLLLLYYCYYHHHY